MDKEQIKRIKEKLAKDHHIIIDESDPIFAILTANEIVLNDYVKKIDQVNAINLLNMESQYSKIIDEMQNLAEKRIGLAIDKTNNDLKITKNQILKDIAAAIKEKESITPKEKKVSSMSFLYIGISIVISLLIGLNIGIYLK